MSWNLALKYFYLFIFCTNASSSWGWDYWTIILCILWEKSGGWKSDQAWCHRVRVNVRGIKNIRSLMLDGIAAVSQSQRLFFFLVFFPLSSAQPTIRSPPRKQRQEVEGTLNSPYWLSLTGKSRTAWLEFCSMRTEMTFLCRVADLLTTNVCRTRGQQMRLTHISEKMFSDLALSASSH